VGWRFDVTMTVTHHHFVWWARSAMRSWARRSTHTSCRWGGSCYCCCYNSHHHHHVTH
jgi:hypothetical protein